MKKLLQLKKNSGLSQIQIIALGFFLIIMAGTFLLMLPFSSKGQPASFLTALFTATSATCVTGLVVVDTFCSWTLFGQLVILCLIQVGGLGFVTIAVFFSIYIRRTISLRERGLMQESVNTLQIAGVVRLAKLIVKGTFLFEGIGAILLALCFVPRFGPARGIYFGIFHSVSAFCNAGFDLMGEATGEYSSLVSYVGDPVVNLTIMTLIVIGGIGFVVWDDVRSKGLRFHRYKLQTKVVMTVTAILIFGSALVFWLLERQHLMADMTVSEAVFASLFSSVTARTAGFNTIDTAALTPGSKLLTIVLMFIGGSPGSTAGGIKTTTIVVLIMYAISTLSNQSGCNVFDRRVPEDMVRKAGVVLILNLGLAITAGVFICGLQPHVPLESVLFEVFSAIGTVGMSTGITRELGTASRYIIIFLMYCGRIGSMTFALSFTRRKNVNPVQLPVGHLPVG